MAQDPFSNRRYLDGVPSIARKLRNGGGRLIEALQTRHDERLQGFRTKATEGLAALLAEEGYVDPRPVLDELAIRARALATPAAAHLPDRVAVECVPGWWSLCERAVSRRP